MKTYYEAYDGKTFTNKAECQEYEYLYFINKIKGWSVDSGEITIEDLANKEWATRREIESNDLLDMLGDSSIIYIEDVETLHYIQEYCIEYDEAVETASATLNVGFNFNFYSTEWYSLEKIRNMIIEATTELNKIENFRKELNFWKKIESLEKN